MKGKAESPGCGGGGGSRAEGRAEADEKQDPGGLSIHTRAAATACFVRQPAQGVGWWLRRKGRAWLLQFRIWSAATPFLFLQKASRWQPKNQTAGRLLPEGSVLTARVSGLQPVGDGDMLDF